MARYGDYRRIIQDNKNLHMCTLIPEVRKSSAHHTVFSFGRRILHIACFLLTSPVNERNECTRVQSK